MANLITRARAIYNLNNRATTSDEDTTLDALIAAASREIEVHCRRTFALTTFDEVHAGRGQRELVLDNLPIVSVERVACAPAPVLRVVNSSSANQRATVKVTATGLELIRVASGTATTSTIAFADQATLSALATAVTALGNGWSAAVVHAEHASRASADLRALQGAFSARDAPAFLSMHTTEVAGFASIADRGILLRTDGQVWNGGPQYWRVIYRAGYSAVPDDVQEACAQWVAQLFWQTKRDPGLTSESVPGVVARAVAVELPAAVRRLMGLYRNRTI